MSIPNYQAQNINEDNEKDFVKIFTDNEPEDELL